jgi:hypothetical protein
MQTECEVTYSDSVLQFTYRRIEGSNCELGRAALRDRLAADTITAAASRP